MSDIAKIFKSGHRREHFDIEDVFGHSVSGAYVPGVGDSVRDWDTGLFRVSEVSDDHIAVLVPHVDVGRGHVVDVLKASSAGEVDLSYRAYVNNLLTVPTIHISDSLFIHSRDAVGYKLFTKDDLSEQTGPINLNPTTDGEYEAFVLSPLVPLGQPDGNSDTVMSPKFCYTRNHLRNGDVLVLVTYNAFNVRIGMTEIEVEENTTYMSQGTNKKTVSSISLISSVVAIDDSDVIDMPLHMSPLTMSLLGRVTYSNGDSKLIPVTTDGEMQLHGLSAYRPNRVGHTSKMILGYKLGTFDVTAEELSVDNRHITRPYTARTVEVQGTSAVTLMVCPEWSPVTIGAPLNSNDMYRLKFYLFSLDRDILVDVTSLVSLSNNSSRFDGTFSSFGYVQRVTVRLNLSEVLVGAVPYSTVANIHVQTFDILLKGAPDTTYSTALSQGDAETIRSPWCLNYDLAQPMVASAVTNNLAALVSHIAGVPTDRMLNISCGIQDETEGTAAWLSVVYDILPVLYSPTRESRPPRPTHFTVYYNDRPIALDVPVGNWNHPIQYATDPQYQHTAKSQVRIEFTRRSATESMKLGVVNMNAVEWTQ